MGKHPHGALALPDGGRRLSDAQPPDHPERDDVGLRSGQRAQEPQAGAELNPGGGLGGGISAVGQIFVGERHRVGDAARAAATGVGCPVAGDGEYPRPEPELIAAEVPEAPHDREPHLRGQIMGVVPGHDPEIADQPWMELPPQGGERVLIAVPRPRHELLEGGPA